MPREVSHPQWGKTPWSIYFQPAPASMPREADFAVVGAGFSGLSAAAWLRRLAPDQTVVVFESAAIGAGASGHTGGMVLSETAAGDLPGLGDVLGGFSSILKDLELDCDLEMPGVFEIGRSGGLPDSPISWADSGHVRAVNNVPGGMVDPGKLVSGLARAAEKSGAHIFEKLPVEEIELGEVPCLRYSGGELRARKVLFASNSMSLEMSNLACCGQPKFTLAVATEPLTAEQSIALGFCSRKPFYTIDFPYLWGRLLANGGCVFGCGLVPVENWRELESLDINAGQSADLISRLESRVRGLHPVMKNVRFANRWGGPILIANEWRPVFAQHPRSANAIVLGAFSGHGVAQSVYLGRWAAEALLGRKTPPDWNAREESA
ncbi:MAG TPA: FAD-binding oxidoreductase [Candidatus Acidoferrales bacterium]|jgi:glycine/D-amino acid oxidase-like deaminating enzyme|nr:FAD-binding oxidoreductase [Candidatus Acidoferrales bacterium]